MQHFMVYMTAGDREEALRIGRALVAEKLAACVNILGPTTSIYQWQGSVEESSEVAFVAKTTIDRMESLQRRVQDLHSYACPCIVAMPIEAGLPAFLDWIVDETRA